MNTLERSEHLPRSEMSASDVVDLLPSISALKPSSRNALKNVLSNPKKAEKLLGLMHAIMSDDENEDQP